MTIAYLRGRETGLVINIMSIVVIKAQRHSPGEKQTNKIEYKIQPIARKSRAGKKFNLCKLNWQIIGPEAGSRKWRGNEEGPAMAIT